MTAITMPGAPPVLPQDDRNGRNGNGTPWFAKVPALRLAILCVTFLAYHLAPRAMDILDRMVAGGGCP